MPIRAFIALMPNQNELQKILNVKEQLGFYTDSQLMRWTKPHQYHLTLRFLGNIEHSEVEYIDSELTSIQADRIQLQFNQLTFLPSVAKAKVMAMGADLTSELSHCLKSVDQALHGAGVHPSRKTFLPHITLARLKKPLEQIQNFNELTVNELINFNELHFIQSQLTPKGPVYSTLSQRLLN